MSAGSTSRRESVVRAVKHFEQRGSQPPVPAPAPDPRELVPEIPELEFSFTLVRLDPRQLGQEIAGRMANSTLWPRYRQIFRSGQIQAHRRPLCPLSQWHLALALAAGQISGLVSCDSRILLVKGATFKRKEISREFDHRPDGSVLQTTVAIDRFVPVIKAIDLTPHTPLFGSILTIR